MSSPYRQKIAEGALPPRFAQNLSLTGATTLGLGALMGAGLYLLLGLAAEAAGSLLWLAFAICGLLTYLSVGLFAELGARMPVSGGAYVYAYRTLGSFWGYMVGWNLTLGAAFACAIFASSFSTHLGAILPLAHYHPALPKLAALAIIALLALAASRPSALGRRISNLLTWLNLAVLVLILLVAVPSCEPAHLALDQAHGWDGLVTAISLISMAFFGYQLIANNAEEVKVPQRNVPRAMLLAVAIAIGVNVAVTFVVAAAMPASDLAAHPSPLVLVTSNALGRLGLYLVVFGGLIAAAAALNSTLISQARQIFAMGRDHFLPEFTAKLTARAKVPLPALLIGTGLVLGLVLFAELPFIAKSAAFCLVFARIPLSFSLHRVYRSEGYRHIAWFKRPLPWVALMANLALLYTLDSQALFFGGTLVAIGSALYFTYAHASEQRGQAGLTVALAARPRPFLTRGERILVPVANPHSQASLFAISEALLHHDGGEIVVVNVIVADDGDSPREALCQNEAANCAVEAIERFEALAQEHNVRFCPLVRAAKNLGEGIAHAAVETHSSLIVMGWSLAADATPSAMLATVARETRSDLVLLHLKAGPPPKRIAVFAGTTGRNLTLMVRVATALAEHNSGRVTYLNIVGTDPKAEHMAHARQVLMEAIREHHAMVPFRTAILNADSPLEAIVARSKKVDLIVVGASQLEPFRTSPFSDFAAMVAQRAHCSVLLVRATSPFNKWLARPHEPLLSVGQALNPQRRIHGT